MHLVEQESLHGFLLPHDAGWSTFDRPMRALFAEHDVG
jgi:hypothetical protein